MSISEVGTLIAIVSAFAGSIAAMLRALNSFENKMNAWHGLNNLKFQQIQSDIKFLDYRQNNVESFLSSTTGYKIRGNQPSRFLDHSENQDE